MNRKFKTLAFSCPQMVDLSLAFPEITGPAIRLETALEQLEQLVERPSSPITAVRRIPARAAELAALPEGVSPALARVLRDRAIERPYSHFEAITAGKNTAGKNVGIVTPTASGKTLCYDLPVLQHLIENGKAESRRRRSI